MQRVIQEWSETDQDLTHMDNIRLEREFAQLERIKCKWLDLLRLACTNRKRTKLGQQMLHRCGKELIFSRTLDKWINAMPEPQSAASDTPETVLSKNVSTTPKQGDTHRVMTKRERKTACNTMRHKSMERYGRILALHSFGSWSHFVVKRNGIHSIKKRTKQGHYATAWKEWMSAIQLIKLRKNTSTRYRNELVEDYYTVWHELTFKAVRERQELFSKVEDDNDTPRKVGFTVEFEQALWQIASITDKKRCWRHVFELFQIWKQTTSIVLFMTNCAIRNIFKNFQVWHQMICNEKFTMVCEKRFLLNVIAKWSKSAVTKHKVRVLASWKPMKRSFLKWRKRYHLKQKKWNCAIVP